MDFDIFKIFSEQEYAKFWHHLITVTLKGFWVRFFALISLVMGLWMLIKKRNVQGGMFFVFLALILTYGYAIVSVFWGQ